MGLRYPLINHGSTAAADQIPQPAAQESMLFVGHQRLSVLPAKAKVITAAVLAPLDWGLIGRHGHPSLQQHNIPQKQEIARGTAHYYQIVIIWVFCSSAVFLVNSVSISTWIHGLWGGCSS